MHRGSFLFSGCLGWNKKQYFWVIDMALFIPEGQLKSSCLRIKKQGKFVCCYFKFWHEFYTTDDP